MRALGVFNTFVVGLQGCGARGPAGDGATDGLAKTPAPAAVAPAPAAQLAAAPRGPLRVIIDAEPVTLSPEGDAWGARIARLTGDPMLPCEPDGRAAASLVSQTPAHLQLRPRAGVRPQEVAAALEGARVRLGSIDRVELLAGAVRIYLKRPDALLTGALCDLPVPGTGPFRLAAPLVRGRPLVLARARGAGVPTIVFSAEPDAPRALGRLRHGEADVLGRLPEAYWPEQAQGPATRRGFEAVRTGGVRLSYLVWNLRRPPASELDVRSALSEVLDREKLARELHRGLAAPATPGFALDPADAAARLERAGWRDTGAVRTRQGRLLRVTLLASSRGEHAGRLAAAWKEALAKLGVELVLQPADGPGFAARLREGSFDVALVERPTPPGRDLYALVGSHGAENFGGLSSQKVDQAIFAWRGGSGDEAALWRAVLAEAALVPLFRHGEVALKSRALEGIRPAGDWLDLSAARWRP